LILDEKELQPLFEGVLVDVVFDADPATATDFFG
jgi:hypothetical protein